MGLFIPPAVAAHRPHQDGNQQQVQQYDDLAQYVIHQMQRRKLGHNGPEVQRQQREADAHNLATPVAGQLSWHVEMTYRYAIFFQHFPAQAKHQPEQRQLLAERPQQIADIQLHGQQDQAHGEYQQADRQSTDQIDQDRFRGVQLAVVTQLPHFRGQLRLVLFQPFQTPAYYASDEQQRQSRQEGNHYRRPGFLPVHGNFHAFDLGFQRFRERFKPVPVHGFIAVYPENLLGQDLLEAFRNAHQLLLVDLQVNRHHQLVAQLLVKLIEQFAAHVHHLQQRVVNLGVHFT